MVDVDAAAGTRVADRLIQSGHTAAYFEFDLAANGGFEELIESIEVELGAVSALVNSAGISLRKPIADVTLDEWERVMHINLRGAWLMSRAVLKRMVERRDGCVVNIGSIQALGPAPGFGVYSATKAALGALARSIAMDYGHLGIRAATVVPGRVTSANNVGVPAHVVDHYVAHRQMLPYEITGRDVGEVVAMLISPAGHAITAAEFVVDAGSSAMAFDRDTPR